MRLSGPNPQFLYLYDIRNFSSRVFEQVELVELLSQLDYKVINYLESVCVETANSSYVGVR